LQDNYFSLFFGRWFQLASRKKAATVNFIVANFEMKELSDGMLSLKLNVLGRSLEKEIRSFNN
jgi:hypothetical protein